jgi:hypothetical protein
MQTLMQSNSPMTPKQELSATPEPGDRSHGLNWLLQPLTPEEEAARVQFLKPGGARLREALCSVPYWAEGERRAMEQGGQAAVDEYWMVLFGNERNLHRPPKINESSTAAVKVQATA